MFHSAYPPKVGNSLCSLRQVRQRPLRPAKQTVDRQPGPSAMRDLSAIECAYAKTVRNCSISDVLGGKPPLKIPDIYRSRVRKQPLVIPYSYQSAATHTHLLERRYEFGDDGLFALLARRLSGVTSTQGDVSCAADAFLRASVSADLLIELTSQHLSRVSRAPHARVT